MAKAGQPKYSGMRRNEGKTPFSFIYEWSGALAVVCRVAAQGAIKYSRGNWKQGLCELELLDSHDRHMHACFGKDERYDQEFGTHHIAHAIWNLLVLLSQRLAHGVLYRNPETGEIEKIRGRDKPFRTPRRR